MMKVTWCITWAWLLLLLLCVLPLVDSEGTDPPTKKQQQQQKTATTKQQQSTAKQQPKQQNVKLSAGTGTAGSKVKAAPKPAAGVKAKAGVKTKVLPEVQKVAEGFKQGEKLARKIKSLEQQLKEAQDKAAELREQQQKHAEAAAKAQAREHAQKIPRVLHKQPIISERDLERPTNALKCAKNANFFCVKETTCCQSMQGQHGCCPTPGVSDHVTRSRDKHARWSASSRVEPCRLI